MDGPMVSCARGTRTRDQWYFQGGGAPSRAHNRDQSGHPFRKRDMKRKAGNRATCKTPRGKRKQRNG